MRVLSVLDVGDGACSLLRFPGGKGPVTVIDCGSLSTADRAADRLVEALRGRVTEIDTIVVTHFDTDHYAGFLRLAERMQATGERFDKLTLVAPTVPATEEAYGFAFQALATTVTGLRSLDLAGELSRVTTQGAFRYMPLARGGTIRAVGHEFRVHWPPAYLHQSVAGPARRAIRLFRDLAHELEQRGDATLKDNFERARGRQWLSPTGDGDWSDEPEAALRSEWAAKQLADFADGQADDTIHSPGLERLDVPQDLLGHFRLAWDAFRKANNSMSLVLDELHHRHLVAFGDVGPSIVRALSSPGEFAHLPYTAMLAPHHGTHPLPTEFAVQAVRCVSQNGPTHERRWINHRKTHRNHDRCYTTAAQGKIEVGQHSPWCRSDPLGAGDVCATS